MTQAANSPRAYLEDRAAWPGGGTPAARGRRRVAVGLSVACAAVLLLVIGPRPARAQSPYLVNDTVDAVDSNLNDGRCESTPGNCTLRAAIMQAEHDGGGTVELEGGLGDFHLTIPAGDEGDSTLSCPTTGAVPVHNNCPTNRTGDLDIHTHIRVIGQGVADSVIDGTHVTRIFDVHDDAHGRGDLELTDLTLENGNSEFDKAANHEHGGAIHNHGTIRLERVAVIDSTSDRPSEAWGGGGITNADSGDATLLNVTIAGNSTNFEGGGIENKGVLRMFYVTITGNSAPGIRCSPFASRGFHCVLWQGGGLFLAANSTTYVADTIVADNGRGHDCAGPGAVRSSGGNVQGDGSCPFDHATDRIGDPGFDPGAPGPPRWFPLLATSPAVDVPTTLICGVAFAALDIRGAVRPQGGDPENDGFLNCDSGSFER